MNETPYHILLAEDEPGVRIVAEDLLSSFGYTVTAVANGSEALAALETVQPDLILSDIRMPVMDGFQLLEEIRSEPTWQHIPFVVVSARAESSDLRTGMLLGADDYLTKPYQPIELEKAIAMRLRRARRVKDAVDCHQRLLTRTLPRELGTPLTGVIAVGNLMAESAAEGRMLSREELADYARVLQQSGNRLFRIVKNFLLWSRLESTALREGLLDPRLVEMVVAGASVRQVAETVAAQFNRRVDLVVECPAKLGIRVMTHDFEFVAAHLIENAFKFSAAGSPVRVTVSIGADMLQLAVSDEGRGMTDAQIASVGLLRQFDPGNLQHEGTGMGLMLAISFARLSGGSLKLQPGAGGLGLIATMHLPLAAGVSQAVAPVNVAH